MPRISEVLGVLLALSILFGVTAHLRAGRLAGQLEASEGNLRLSRQLRLADQQAYAEAQRIAESLERARVDLAVSQQKEITDASIGRYANRVASLDSMLAGLREQVRRAAAAPSAGDGQPVPAVSEAARAADGEADIAYAPCDRDCLGSLIQLDELISWVERQAAPSEGKSE